MLAWYATTVGGFLRDSDSQVIASLAERFPFHNLLKSQIAAWVDQIKLLRRSLTSLTAQKPSVCEWGILLEYPIPRRSGRIDAVLLAGELIIVLEFKNTAVSAESVRQLEDYCLDLRDFHSASRSRQIIPILVAVNADAFPGASDTVRSSQPTAQDLVAVVTTCSGATLPETLSRCLCAVQSTEVKCQDFSEWDSSPYLPTPTIIEAATVLYSDHSVSDITHSHAGIENLSTTSTALLEVVQQSRSRGEKAICFVTGVPGAGKTLVGLNAVHSTHFQDGECPGVFLTGNRPLVEVVREAIVRDRASNTGRSRGSLRREVRTFIQVVREFIDFYRENGNRPPLEHVAVFDEAQRAWDAKKHEAKFGHSQSEPDLMLEVMDRHKDWAVLIALVGGGQEIHDGEAGLAEWGRVLLDKYLHWRVYASPEALWGGSSVAGSALLSRGDELPSNTTQRSELHLNVSIRSYTARQLADWVNQVLEGRISEAARVARRCREFPVYLTRSLEVLKSELRERTRGSRRCGLVASSGAVRLRGEGLEISSAFRQSYPYPEWFLAPSQDVRSSHQLEVVATEFEIQGLELDWTGLCWGNDFSWDPRCASWSYRSFSGSRWQVVRGQAKQEFLRNKYRVLLTRGREGVVIWVPTGDINDQTRDPERLNETAAYLLECGVRSL